MWYVNQFEVMEEALVMDSFILTMWYVNLFF